MRQHTVIRARHHPRCQQGYTLVELLIAMVIMLIILAALTDGFASATRAETDQVARASDQENARQTLDRMRRDIHCASGVQPAVANAYSGYTLTLTETANLCPGVTTASSGIQWCTIQIAANRYQLFRENSGNCDGVTSTFEVDYVTTANIWPTLACATGQIPKVALDMPVNRDPVTRPGRTYELTDQIVLRNGPACP